MLKNALLLASALLLAFAFPAGAAPEGEHMRELDLGLLARLIDSPDQGRLRAELALELYVEKGIPGLLCEADRQMRLASLPPTSVSAVAHEAYAANCWFLGVLAVLKSGKPEPDGAPGLAVARAAAFFTLTDREKRRLFERTVELYRKMD